MRVAVCVDPMCGLGSRAAGVAIARAFRDQGDQCVVVPTGQAGLGAAEALADILDAEPQLLAPDAASEVVDDAEPLTGFGISQGRASSSTSDALAWLAISERDLIVSAFRAAGGGGPGWDGSGLGDAPASPDAFSGSSWQVGRAVAEALRSVPASVGSREMVDAAPRRLFLDPGAVCWHDGGAGFLEALGATISDTGESRATDTESPANGSHAIESRARALRAGVHGLAGVERVDLTPVVELLDGVELVLLADAATCDRHLCGLRGITSLVGHDRGLDLADMLRVDHQLAAFADACGHAALATRSGSGAAGGLGFAVQALGGRVTTGFDACRELTGLDRALQLADLVVVGCDQLDFGHWDRFSVLPIAGLVDTRVPVVAINRRTHVSQRELRTQGIESAHQLADDAADVPSSEQITERVRAIAASWRMG